MSTTAESTAAFRVTDWPHASDDEGNMVKLEPGFRIIVLIESGEWRLIGCHRRGGKQLDLRFARRCDAEMAIAALVREGLTTGEAMIRAGWKRITQVASEAMQW